MSDLSGIGYFVALVFLFALGLAAIKGIIEQGKNRKKQPKTQPTVNSNSETKNSEDIEHDVTYREDDFEQEDDEFHEEVY